MRRAPKSVNGIRTFRSMSGKLAPKTHPSLFFQASIWAQGPRRLRHSRSAPPAGWVKRRLSRRRSPAVIPSAGVIPLDPFPTPTVPLLAASHIPRCGWLLASSIPGPLAAPLSGFLSHNGNLSDHHRPSLDTMSRPGVHVGPLGPTVPPNKAGPGRNIGRNLTIPA
jgi:hypothetical protein